MSSRPAHERDRWEKQPLVAVADEIQLVTALARGDNDALIGTPESEWLEFKSAPYGIPDPGQRWQLAKDVAGFANSRGGHIVIGVKTAKHPNEVVEAAISCRRPVPSAFSTKRAPLWLRSGTGPAPAISDPGERSV